MGELPHEFPARRGFSISYMGKTLLSRIDPIAQGEKLVSMLPLEEGTLYFCPSPLYGYGLSILFNSLKENSVILCVETDEKLYEISKKAFLTITESKTLQLIKAIEPAELCAFVNKTWGKRVFRRVETVRLGRGWQLYTQHYEDMEKALRREIAVEWSNAMTLIRLGRLYSRNLIRNLIMLPKSRDASALNFSSAPVLVLGAGPSLDSTLDELGAHYGGKIPEQKKRRFKIICVDSCFSALIERGIHPDLVVILESQHYNLKAFIGFKNFKVDAVFDLSALPISTRIFSGDRYIFATPWTELRLIERLIDSGLLPETFPPLGSVGLSSVAIALHLGQGPVICGGLDFSYSIDAYYARCTPGHREFLMRQNRLKGIINAEAAFRTGSFSALSKNGKQVRSDPALRNYWELFGQQFGGNTRLLDINSSGLSIGVKTVSAAEAFAILNDDTIYGTTGSTTGAVTGGAKIKEFILKEIDTIDRLRDILSGAVHCEAARLEEFLDNADYLWAHFPECAGAGGRRPPITDLSFLKRVRTEIEPFRKLWEMSLNSLND